MSLRNTDVRTPGIAAIAKKWKLSIAKVSVLVKQGAQHEKEHNTDERKAEQVARDHINERPDYYKMLKKADKSKISIKEETGISGIRGLGFVSGDPAVADYIQQYIDTNAMSYDDLNGNILQLIRDKHSKFHKNMGFGEYTPNDMQTNFMKEAKETPTSKLNELGELDKTGAEDYQNVSSSRATRLNDMKEEKKMPNPCWKGYKAYGMKKKNGKEVPNCVPVDEDIDESAAWQRKAGKNPEGGLNRKGIASYRRENPGSKLSMAVTTPPSKLKPGSKAAKRRKSFCARMGGMPGPMKDEKGRPTRKALSLRKWNCEEEHPLQANFDKYKAGKLNELTPLTPANLGDYISGAAKSRKAALSKGGAKADVKTWGKRQKGIETAIKKLTKVDEFWSPFLSPHHKHSARLSREKAQKPDTIMDPPGKHNRVYAGKNLEENTHRLKEETKMDNKDLINEAIENILENKLNHMKENLTAVLQEKAQEKLEERKKEIAAQYFAQ